MAAAQGPSEKQKLYGAYGLFWFCFLFFLIGMGAPNWSGFKVTSNPTPTTSVTSSGYSGLWRGCSYNSRSSQTLCTDIKCDSSAQGAAGTNCSKLDATRTFTIFSFFGMLFSAIVYSFFLFWEKIATAVPAVGANKQIETRVKSKIFVIAFLGVTDFLIMLAWAIYASTEFPSGINYGYDFCFAFMIIVWLLLIVVMALIWITPLEGRTGGPAGTGAAPATQSKPVSPAATTPKA
jgi:hypothetical protein